nr:hypothetical protein [uncultured Mediterranean phage uvMED]
MAIQLKGNNTSSYSSPITLGADAPASQGSTYYSTSVDLRRDDGGAVYNVFRNGSALGNRTIILNSDASASFGTGTIGTSGGVEKVDIHNGYGQIQVQSAAGGNAIYRGYNSDGVASFTVRGNGSVANGSYSSFTHTPTGEGVGIFPDGAIDLVRYNDGADAPVLRVYNTTGSDVAPDTEPTVTIKNNGAAFFYRPTSTNSNSILHVSSDVNGTNSFQFYVTANGVISARSTAISQIGSERRIKKDIELIDPVKSWETIRDLPYYSYKLKDNDQSTYYGPIVDECPEEMVVEGRTSDEEGNIRTYDNSILQSRLFVALQTALTRIEALEAQLTQLTGGAN